MKSIITAIMLFVFTINSAQINNNVTTPEIYDYLVKKFDNNVNNDINFETLENYEFIKIGAVSFGKQNEGSKYIFRTFVYSPDKSVKALICEREKLNRKSELYSYFWIVPFNNNELEKKFFKEMDSLNKKNTAEILLAVKYFFINHGSVIMTKNKMQEADTENDTKTD